MGRSDFTAFRAALGLSLASGCAALAHELLWTRRLIDLLGASAASSTRVFSCFFLGLAVGAAVAAIRGRQIQRPWRAIAMAEAGVALLALPSLFLPYWTGWIWPALGAEGLTGWVGPAIKLTLSVIVVFPPSFCMGLVLPLMARAVLCGRCEFHRHGVWLYGVNTLGGVAGLALVSLVTLHTVGAAGSMSIAIGINLLVACGCLILDTKYAREISRNCDDAPERNRVRRCVYWPAMGVAFFSGAGLLSFEVLALHLIGLSAPLSFYAPMVVLTVVVLVLGVAALIVPRLVRPSGGGPTRLLGLAMLATCLCMVTSPLWFFQLVQWISLGARENLLAYVAILVATSLAALGPTVWFAGMVFPTVLAWMGSAGNDRHGYAWGWLLAANGMGGLIGAELTYFAVVPAMGIHRGIGCVGVSYGVASVVWVLLGSRRKTASAFISCAALTVAILITLGPLSWLPHVNPRGVVVLEEWQGREGAVAVVESPNLGRRIVMSNQYVLGGTKFRYDQARLAHIPLLMHADPRRVVSIGLATGITPGAALEHRCVESLTAVELSPLVVRAADTHFRSFNHNVTRDPRPRVVVEDGRTYLAATPASCDVVIGDLFLPWAPGEARLYSLEHFQSVRAALRPKGLFCQWLAMYQLTPEHLEIIQATFCRVFPHAYLFRGTFNCQYPTLALVGFCDSELDWATIEARCHTVRQTNEVLDPLVRHADGLAMLYLGRADATNVNEKSLNTLTNMRLELAAGRDRISGRLTNKYLSGEAWLQYTGELLMQRKPYDGPGQRQVQLAWVCQRLSVYEAVRQHAGLLSREDLMQLPTVMDEIKQSFPESIRADRDADWSQWPGDAAFFHAMPE